MAGVEVGGAQGAILTLSSAEYTRTPSNLSLCSFFLEKLLHAKYNFFDKNL
jgi:hypothetical protein